MSWKKKRWRQLLLKPTHSLEPKSVLFILTPINLTTTLKFLKKRRKKRKKGQAVSRDQRRVMRAVKGEGQCSQF